jgi:single-stranded-DNA-specific exonuclease
MSFNSVTNKDWELKLADKNKILFLREKFSISEILSRLLVLRNISIDQIESFLKPEINKHLIDPNLLLDMNKSVKLIIDDILNKKITGIFGDYDVDGASATAILIKFFNHINHNSKFYIPYRVNEGY